MRSVMPEVYRSSLARYPPPHAGSCDCGTAKGRVYEILNRKRPLTMAMVWKLHSGLGIPAESLIKQAA